MKNKIFHTQDLCLRTNLRCAKDSARMEINLKKYIAAIGICFMALGAACIMKKDPEEVGEELPELSSEEIIMSHIIIWMTLESR